MTFRNSMAEATIRATSIGTPPNIVTASVPADLNANKSGAATAVIAGLPMASGASGQNYGPPAKAPISLRSLATGPTRANIGITIR